MTGADGFLNRLSLTRTNISENYDRWTRDELYSIQQDMERKIKFFEFKGTLRESLTIAKEFETNDKVGWTLFTDSDHASYNEFGVPETTVYTKGKPSLQDWCEEKFGFVPGLITIGGPASSIKLGSSINKFFFNTIEEYASENTTRVIGREVRKTTNKYLRGK